MKFDASLKSDLNVEDINEDSLDISLVISAPTVELVEANGLKPDDALDFNWMAESFTQGDEIKIQLNFSNPIYISQGTMDLLQVQIKDNDVFDF